MMTRIMSGVQARAINPIIIRSALIVAFTRLAMEKPGAWIHGRDVLSAAERDELGLKRLDSRITTACREMEKSGTLEGKRGVGDRGGSMKLYRLKNKESVDG